MSVLLRKRFLQRRISALRQAFHRWWPCGHCDASGGPMRAVILTGTGSGTVSSQPKGIDCGGTCSATFDNGTGVALTPAAAAGSQFGGWGGACTGTAGCTVTMDREQVVAVRFQPVAPPPQKLAYTITEIPGVEGNSSLMPSGIDSRGDLVGSYWIT